MASAFSHAVVALGLGSPFHKTQIPIRVWVAGVVCSVLPDLDVIGFRFGIRYGDFLGHRGFSHSLVFAALLASAGAIVLVQHKALGIGPFSLFSYLFLVTASHGFLDAMTDGGLGVAFFSPFDNHRYFFPWRPIHVSPIAVARFFTPQGLAILQSEFEWIWLPTALFALSVLLLRRKKRRDVIAK